MPYNQKVTLAVDRAISWTVLLSERLSKREKLTSTDKKKVTRRLTPQYYKYIYIQKNHATITK